MEADNGENIIINGVKVQIVQEKSRALESRYNQKAKTKAIASFIAISTNPIDILRHSLSLCMLSDQIGRRERYYCFSIINFTLYISIPANNFKINA